MALQLFNYDHELLSWRCSRIWELSGMGIAQQARTFRRDELQRKVRSFSSDLRDGNSTTP
jgi:hypothetical protein